MMSDVAAVLCALMADWTSVSEPSDVLRAPDAAPWLGLRAALCAKRDACTYAAVEGASGCACWCTAVILNA